MVIAKPRRSVFICLVAVLLCIALCTQSIAGDLSPVFRAENDSPTATSFEECEAGSFTQLFSDLGTLSAGEGHASIDNAHSRTGQRSLRLLGGKQISVVLQVRKLATEPEMLQFYAERWTKRGPFAFRVESSQDGKQWREIYNGDKKVQIGKFSTKVTIPLDVSPKQLRFTATTPQKSGLLIDDLSFTKAVPATKPASSDLPNILLIVGEDHGCELSCYGDPVIKTPNIDQLAAAGILYENGYVTQSVCSPSRSTIFTGLFPHQNGQLGLATHKFGWYEKWPTTYSKLKSVGYRTGLIGKTHVIPADAVESHVDFRFQKSSNFAKRKVADYATEAGKFFAASDVPFFMTVNYPDAHWPLQGKVDGLPKTQVAEDKIQVMPYIGGETPRMREVVRNYYDCMLRLDECVGQLLQQLDKSGKREKTLVIFIGDHGAQMARGKVTVYEGGMRVPFIARWPGVIQPKQRSRALVSTIDLLPTFLDVAQVKPLPGLPGKSLRSAFRAEDGVKFGEFVACERNCDASVHTFPQRTIRDQRFKLIYSPVRDREDPAARYYRVHGASHWSGCLTDEELKGMSKQTQDGYARWLNPPIYQLYDLKEDPHEWKDLSDNVDHSEVKSRLVKAMKNWQLETRDPLMYPGKLKMLMDETDALNAAKKRSPAGGWKYLKYWHPKTLVVPLQLRF
jgi:N-sulfoglucosamine sulfohydrolase